VHTGQQPAPGDGDGVTAPALGVERQQHVHGRQPRADQENLVLRPDLRQRVQRPGIGQMPVARSVQARQREPARGRVSAGQHDVLRHAAAAVGEPEHGAARLGLHRHHLARDPGQATGRGGLRLRQAGLDVAAVVGAAGEVVRVGGQSGARRPAHEMVRLVRQQAHAAGAHVQQMLLA
jgi:hypothetical protein